MLDLRSLRDNWEPIVSARLFAAVLHLSVKTFSADLGSARATGRKEDMGQVPWHRTQSERFNPNSLDRLPNSFPHDNDLLDHIDKGAHLLSR